MGEMADLAVDIAIEELEHYERYRKKTNPVSAGYCPKCGSETQLIDGRFGFFYGCVTFPKCKGSRNI